MKPILRFTLAVILFVAALPSSVSAQKVAPSAIAHFDLDSLLKVMPDYKKAEESMNAYAAQLDNQLQSMQNEWQQKKLRYDSLRPTLPKILNDQNDQDLALIEERIRRFSEEARTSIVTKQDELLKPLYEKIKAATKAVALRKGYKYVITTQEGSTSVLYASPSDDIFMDLVRELGVTLPAPKPTTPTTPPAGK